MRSFWGIIVKQYAEKVIEKIFVRLIVFMKTLKVQRIYIRMKETVSADTINGNTVLFAEKVKCLLFGHEEWSLL
jgi:hypothetical protein